MALLGLGVLVSVVFAAVPDWIAGTLAVWFLAVVFGVYAYYLYGRAQTLEGASEATPGSVAPGQGLIHVTGVAAPAAEGETVSPEDRDEEVLGYHLKVTEKERKRADQGEVLGGGSRTNVLRNEKEVAPFYVEGNGGAVLVDADHADLDIEWDEEPDGRTGLHWAALEEGDEITVFGAAMAPDDRQGPPGADLASKAADLARDKVADIETAQEAVEAQHGGANPTDQETADAPDVEEAAAGLDEAEETMEDHLQAGTKATTSAYAADEDVVLSRDPDDGVLVVSESSPEDVVSGERWGGHLHGCPRRRRLPRWPAVGSRHPVRGRGPRSPSALEDLDGLGVGLVDLL